MIDFDEGVYLGPLEEVHKPALRIWRNNREVWKWCRQNDVISRHHHNQWWDWQSDAKSVKMYAIMVEDFIVGVAGLTSIDMTNRRAEFSLYINPKEQGNGYGRKALRTLVSHGIYNLGLNSIWGESYAGNPAIKMFESVGFKYEGSRREYYFREGKFIDAHLYSILSKEWK